MRYTTDESRRLTFRDWLRVELQRLDFYVRRGNRYLVAEFVHYAEERGAHLEEVSMGRYLRDESPVLPTPETCRELAHTLGKHPTEVLLQAGYLSISDFLYVPALAVPAEAAEPAEVERIGEEIDHYRYLPAAIRQQMKAALGRGQPSPQSRPLQRRETPRPSGPIRRRTTQPMGG